MGVGRRVGALRVSMSMVGSMVVGVVGRRWAVARGVETGTGEASTGQTRGGQARGREGSAGRRRWAVD